MSVAMVASVSERSRTCITTLKGIVSSLSNRPKNNNEVHQDLVQDEIERLSLWIGNIGALHRPESSMSLESRLHEANDVLAYSLELLGDLQEVTKERRSSIIPMPMDLLRSNSR